MGPLLKIRGFLTRPAAEATQIGFELLVQFDVAGFSFGAESSKAGYGEQAEKGRVLACQPIRDRLWFGHEHSGYGLGKSAQS